MTKGELRNIAHSVHQRLLDKAKETNRPFNELLQYYAMERFLYRLSKSEHAGKYILKGALMLRVWQTPMARPTMDIDMLGKTSNDADEVMKQFEEICDINVEPDELKFDGKTILAERITREADYEGLRLRFKGMLGNARINLQIDIGFGDVVFPKPKTVLFPIILDFAPPEISCYSKESSVSEKLEAMVRHGDLNSRMKDFYDIWLLSKQFEFNGNVLQKAVSKTFRNRKVEMPKNIAALTKDFAVGKQKQWQLFRQKLAIASVPEDFWQVVRLVSSFLKPVANAIASGSSFNVNWDASVQKWKK